MLGNFIMFDNPSISNLLANGPSSLAASVPNPASDWPRWTEASPMILNLNTSGGTPYTWWAPNGATVTQFKMPGLQNNFTIANAMDWEGGRGKRCEIWKKLSPLVPQ